MLFFKDKNELYRWLRNAEGSPLVMILQHFLVFAVAIIICMMIDALFFSCRPAEETTNVRTEVQTQRDTTHTTLDVYDRVEVKDSWQYGSWFVQDSLLAHIRIIDFDTLGRPTRTIDADLHRGTATSAKQASVSKDTASTKALHTDSTTAAESAKETVTENREITRQLPWWQCTSFRIAAAVLAAIIAILIAYLTRHRWLNRILSWLLHKK